MTHLLESSNIIMTGGAGTLGTAIAERRKREGWTGKLTVYSSDNHKHEVMRRKYPDVNFVQGDIRNAETLRNAMIGHDICLHLAAVKVIPDSEWYTLDTIDVNVNGTINVCVQAIAAGIDHVLAISTDKAAHAANAYGATKYLTEKVLQEYARAGYDTHFHLARYGNVLESNSSVIQIWKQAIANGQPIKITNPAMTRFWISPQQAVDIVLNALNWGTGKIYIPKMKKLSVGTMANYVLGDTYDHVIIPTRPGEKLHETLVTEDECRHAFEYADHFVLHPTTSGDVPYHTSVKPYTSEFAPDLTKEELLALLENA